MSDKDLLKDILQQVRAASDKVIARFSAIHRADDFTDSPEGMEKLDAICMQLIAIGESVKNIDKIAGKSLLANYDSVDWRGVKGLRDIITHHYFDIDAEAIFEVCKTHIPKLRVTIDEIISDLS